MIDTTMSLTSASSVPPVPQNVAASLSNGNAIINWNDVVGETGYEISRSDDNQVTWHVVAPATPPDKGGWYEVAPAPQATLATYWYRVRSFNSAGYSGYSSTASITVGNSGAGTVYTGTLPIMIPTATFGKNGKKQGNPTPTPVVPATAYYTVFLDFGATPAQKWGAYSTTASAGSLLSLADQALVVAGFKKLFETCRLNVVSVKPTSGYFFTLHDVNDFGAWQNIGKGGVTYDGSLGGTYATSGWIFEPAIGANPGNVAVLMAHEFGRACGISAIDNVTPGEIMGNPTGYGIEGVIPAAGYAYWSAAHLTFIQSVLGKA